MAAEPTTQDVLELGSLENDRVSTDTSAPSPNKRSKRMRRQPTPPFTSPAPPEADHPVQHSLASDVGPAPPTNEASSRWTRASKALDYAATLALSAAAIGIAWLIGRHSSEDNREAVRFNLWRACQDLPNIRHTATCTRLLDMNFDKEFAHTLSRRSETTGSTGQLPTSVFQAVLQELLHIEINFIRIPLAAILAPPIDLILRLRIPALAFGFESVVEKLTPERWQNRVELLFLISIAIVSLTHYPTQGWWIMDAIILCGIGWAGAWCLQWSTHSWGFRFASVVCITMFGYRQQLHQIVGPDEVFRVLNHSTPTVQDFLRFTVKGLPMASWKSSWEYHHSPDTPWITISSLIVMLCLQVRSWYRAICFL